MLKRVVLSALAGFVLTGCSTLSNPHGPERVGLGDEQTVFFRTDASQRYVLTTERSSDGSNRSRRITCVEPSPDVAIATSQLVQASAALGGDATYRGGDANERELAGANVDGGVGFSSGTAQSVAELGRRLATIQLLRDSLYRACEAYANGAINEATYAMIVSRYDDISVTLLLGELMGGVADQRAGAVAEFGDVQFAVNSELGDEADAESGNSGVSLNVGGGTSSGTTSVDAAAERLASLTATSSDLLQLQENFLSDQSSVISSLTMACLAILSDPNGRETPLFSHCNTFAGAMVSAAPALVVRDAE